MTLPSARDTRRTPFLALTIAAAVVTVVGGTLLPAPAVAAHPDQGMRSSSRSQPAPRYRTQGGRYRGAQPVRARGYLQPSLSGIRPPGLGKFTFPQSQHPPASHRRPGAPVLTAPVVYVPIGGYPLVQPQAQPQPQVIVVQQPPPPPPQPVVVMVPQPAPPAAATASPPRPAAPAAPPVPDEPGTLRFAVAPADAVIFLDDRRLGIAERVNAAAPLALDAGVHVLEISHPDHADERIVFGLGSAAAMRIEVDLQQSRPSRRSRLDTAP